MAIYDLAGRRVRVALEEPSGAAGLREVGLGEDLAPGVYFYGIETPNQTQGGRFVILR